MMSSKRTAVAALAAATVLAVAPLATALDAGDQMLLPWEACTPAGVVLDQSSQYLLSACGGNALCLDGKYGDVSRCIPNNPWGIDQCHAGWDDSEYIGYPTALFKPCPTGMTCSMTAWGHISGYGDTLQHDSPSICVPTDYNGTIAVERTQLANAADRSVVFDTATVDTYGQCSLNKQCKSKQDLCHGFSSQLTITNSQVSYNGKSGSDCVGFCAPSTLPECSASGSCHSGYKCGSAGAAAGSNVCFPVGDAKVPASYFAATAAPTAAVTQAPATTHTAAATVAPTTVHATVATTPAAATATHSAAPATTAATVNTHAPTTTAVNTVCGAGLQACGSACYDPAQSGYVCHNGQLAQVTQPTNTGVTGEIIDATSAATTAASTQTPTQATTAVATDATQQPAVTAATTAATIPATKGATESPVTASSSTTVAGTSSQKTTTSAASSMLQYTVAPLLLAALSAALAL